MKFFHFHWCLFLMTLVQLFPAQVVVYLTEHHLCKAFSMQQSSADDQPNDCSSLITRQFLWKKSSQCNGLFFVYSEQLTMSCTSVPTHESLWLKEIWLEYQDLGTWNKNRMGCWPDCFPLCKWKVVWERDYVCCSLSAEKSPSPCNGFIVWQQCRQSCTQIPRPLAWFLSHAVQKSELSCNQKSYRPVNKVTQGYWPE